MFILSSRIVLGIGCAGTVRGAGGSCCGLGKSRRGKENAAVRPILARLPLWSLLPVLEGMSTIGYGIKKLSGRYCRGQLMQMAMMATPNLNKGLHYLNKEDRLMRWFVVKYRDTKYGLEFITDYDEKRERMQFSRCSIYDVDADDENEEYEAEEIK